MHHSHPNYAPMLVVRDPREIWKIFSLHCQRQGTLIPSSRADDELFHSVIENIYEERPLKRLGDMLALLQRKEADALDGHGWTQSMIDFMFSVSCNIESGDSVFIDSLDAIIDLYYIASQHFLTLNKHRNGYLLSSTHAFEKIS